MAKESLINKLHEFEPTDSQGYSMECEKCGKPISIYEVEDWDKSLKEECTQLILVS
ncbi:MAG: hypothetical protein K0R54_189 [Clostridiaceae bacterium]|jgi:hypothetical protein|nr:hypothetical protein [Clostridiaceae bacterium]